MARILAIEPDRSLADALGRIIRDRVGAEAVLADSKEAAIAAIAAHVPDLILVSALLSPRDESDLSDHLRMLDEIEHVQILTIPLLAVPVQEPARPSGGLLNAFRRRRAAPAPSGCDPDRYGDELKGYLKLSVAARAEREAQRVRDERAKQRAEALRAPSVAAAVITDAAVESAEEPIPLAAHDDEQAISWLSRLDPQLSVDPLPSIVVEQALSDEPAITDESIDLTDEPILAAVETEPLKIDPVAPEVSFVSIAPTSDQHPPVERALEDREAEALSVWPPSRDILLPDEPPTIDHVSIEATSDESTLDPIAPPEAVADLAAPASVEPILVATEDAAGQAIEEFDVAFDVAPDTGLETGGEASAASEELAHAAFPDPERSVDTASVDAEHALDLGSSVIEAAETAQRDDEAVLAGEALTTELADSELAPVEVAAAMPLDEVVLSIDEEPLAELVQASAAREIALQAADTDAERPDGPSTANLTEIAAEAPEITPAVEVAVAAVDDDAAVGLMPLVVGADPPDAEIELDLELSAVSIEAEKPADPAESAPPPIAATRETPPVLPDALYGLFRTLPAFVEGAEEPPPAIDEDRIALSISSFEIDRQESDDYLLQAANEPTPPTHRVEPERPDTLAWVQSASVADIEPDPDTSDPDRPLVEIWQALPDWVESWPPLEAYVESGTPSKSGAHRIAAAETLAAAAPEPPPLDARSIATALDALRSEFQMFRAQAQEPRAATDTPRAVEAPPVTAVAPPPIVPTAPAAAPANVASQTVEQPPKPKKKKPRKPKPIEDEWGLRHSTQAGIQALIAALDAKAEEEDEEETVEDLAEQLLQYKAPDTPPPPIAPGEVAAARPRLAPLSMWAHVDNGSSDSRVVELKEQDYLRELLEGLDVPRHVASVSY